MPRLRALIFVVLGWSLLPAAAQAEVVTIKLGTVAPDGSTWHVQLKEWAERWAEASGGKVKLKIFAGGVAGNEGDMVRKMRIGQLQAAALSAVGLRDIDASPQAIATPGLIADDAEWEYVFSRMTPIWEKRFLDKGFVPLMWGDTGWVHFFVNREFSSPSEFGGLRVFTWAGDPSAVEGWKRAGFQPVVLSSTDMLPSLTTGMIDAFATTPILALTARWYERAPYMTQTVWGHLPAATLVTKETWDKVPADLRPKLAAIAAEYAKKSDAEVARMQTDAIAAMKKGGLKIIDFDATGRKAWQQVAEKTWSMVRGSVVSAPDFDEVKRIRDEYRASHK